MSRGAKADGGRPDDFSLVSRRCACAITPLTKGTDMSTFPLNELRAGRSTLDCPATRSMRSSVTRPKITSFLRR